MSINECEKNNLIIRDSTKNIHDNKMKFIWKNKLLKILGLLIILYIISVILYISNTFRWDSGCYGSECGLLILPFILFYSPLFFLAFIHFIISLLLLKKLDRYDKVFFIADHLILILPFIIFLVMSKIL
jgi:hypothetical protein